MGSLISVLLAAINIWLWQQLRRQRASDCTAAERQTIDRHQRDQLRLRRKVDEACELDWFELLNIYDARDSAIDRAIYCIDKLTFYADEYRRQWIRCCDKLEWLPQDYEYL